MCKIIQSWIENYRYGRLYRQLRKGKIIMITNRKGGKAEFMEKFKRYLTLHKISFSDVVFNLGDELK